MNTLGMPIEAVDRYWVADHVVFRKVTFLADWGPWKAGQQVHQLQVCMDDGTIRAGQWAAGHALTEAGMVRFTLALCPEEA